MKQIFQCEHCRAMYSTAPKAERCELLHRGTNDSFGFKLAMARTYKNMTQTRLAELTGTYQSVINLYENNKRQPNFAMVKLLCEALDVTASELCGF